MIQSKLNCFLVADHLLEDLQSSVSRPGSSLGSAAPHTYRETSRNVSSYDSGRSNSLNRITNLKPQNPVTDYSSDDAYSYTVGTKQNKITIFYCICSRLVAGRLQKCQNVQKGNVLVQNDRRQNRTGEDSHAEQHQSVGFAAGRSTTGETVEQRNQ